MCLKTDDLADLIQRNIDYLKLIGKGQVTSAHLFWKTIIKMPRKRKYFPPDNVMKDIEDSKICQTCVGNCKAKKQFQKSEKYGKHGCNIDIYFCISSKSL